MNSSIELELKLAKSSKSNAASNECLNVNIVKD